MNGLPPQLRARILAEAKSVPSETVAERAVGARVAIALAALCVTALAYEVGFPRKRPTEVLVALAVGGAIAALAVTWMAVARGKSTLGRPVPVLGTVAALAPFGILAFACLVAAFDHGVVLMGGTPKQHLSCALFSLAFAAGPFAALVYVRRGSDPVHPRALGAAVGAAAGAWGAAMIDVHCSLTTIEHLTLGHALPIVVMTLLGALLGARILGVGARG